MFEIKFVYVTNDTAEKSIKNRIYHYTIPCEMVIYNSDSVTEAAYCADKSNTHFFNKLLGFLFKL
jgi:hypothetical protein